jgi:hypothetical protein
MKRFACKIDVVLDFKDDVEESDIPDIISETMKKLKPVEISVDDIEETCWDEEAELSREDDEEDDKPFWEDDDEI